MGDMLIHLPVFFFDSFEKLVEQLSWQQKDTKRIIRKKRDKLEH
jgi:hypothetical protein